MPEPEQVTRVKDVMRKDVVTIDGTATIIDALHLMTENSIKSLVITPHSETDAYGIVTFTDIAKKIVASDERIEMLNVFDIMTKPCIAVRGNLNIRYAVKLLTDLNISRAIVVDGDILKGIVSLSDIIKMLTKGIK
ncbi:hypothetical protein MNBD_NITROSPINAE01-52 [hydrothermal vent metagenome]|uniref:CBS domain-containing protein n=1 Tax=hydrothermal vent metagenome TaxID=652676 RepID=A0A3B1C1N5_9ZZZZ